MTVGEVDGDDEHTVIVGAVDDEHTVIVGAAADDSDEHTVIVGIAEPEADERTVIVVAADDEPDERTVIVQAAGDEPDEPEEPDEHTVIVVDDDDPTSIVAAPAAGAPSSPAPENDAGELSALDEQSIRRVVRSRRLAREPLRPMPVPPGRHGPMLPGSGAGAVFTAEVRSVPVAAPEAVRPAPITTVRVGVPSVAAASRRSAVIALVTASASVLVSAIGLVWVVQTVLGR